MRSIITIFYIVVLIEMHEKTGKFNEGRRLVGGFDSLKDNEVTLTSFFSCSSLSILFLHPLLPSSSFLPHAYYQKWFLMERVCRSLLSDVAPVELTAMNERAAFVPYAFLEKAAKNGYVNRYHFCFVLLYVFYSVTLHARILSSC